jgi:peptidoglycan-associated lipoprotein
MNIQQALNSRQRLLASVSLLALATLLGACGSAVSLKEPASSVPVETRTPAPTAGAAAGTAGASSGAVPQSGVTTVNLGAGDGLDPATARLTSERIVYFDFDSFAIRDEFRPMLDAHAKRLTSQRERRIVIEGHTDERGGREYNLALGQKRAEAVARSLELLGATPAQIEAVSFGKESPAVQGSNEEAWARNRRAELRDR